jgi:hypothetical protein
VTIARRPFAVAVCTVVALAATGYVASGARAGTDPDAVVARRLLRDVHTASEQHDFTGDATVTWATSTGTRRARVHVTDTGGTVAMTATDGDTVIDEGRRTYLRDEVGWTGVVAPAVRDVPDPSRRWDLSTAGARRVAGRPATVVVVARRGGPPAQRITVDDATGLLLAREVLDPKGKVQRSVRFSSIEVGEPTPAASSPPAGVHAAGGASLAAVPDGYRAPEQAAGLELVSRSRADGGVLLFYSDGVFTAAVLEQRGDLDWSSLPAGGDDSQLADARTRIYHGATGDVAVWERDGLVVTCVTDGPSDVFDGMVGALGSDDRGMAQSVVDFVLAPFGWG